MDKKQTEPVAKQTMPADVPSKPDRTTFWVIVGSCVGVAVLGVMVFGVVLAHNWLQAAREFGPGYMGRSERHAIMERPFTHHIGPLMSDEKKISGVVTAINGDTLTIAGHGTTQTVKTNSATAYHNGNKAALNDSVLVTITGSGETMTATAIWIN